MSNEEPLIFHLQVARKKPENIRHPKGYCPFCDRKNLTNILDKDGDCIWLVNKIRTLQDTMQTIIIESKDHLGDQSNYSQLENRKIIKYVLECWQKMINQNKYKSVLLYKNFGPRSGGSLRHPHFQIVGLDKKDGYANISSKNFQGVDVVSKNNVQLNISRYPLKGFVEFNVQMSQDGDVATFADYIQSTVKFILSDDFYYGHYDSYNLFFYNIDQKIECKIMPRYVASPYFIGYQISQVNNEESLMQIAEALQKRILAE